MTEQVEPTSTTSPDISSPNVTLPNITSFRGKYLVFSNFYPCMISLDGIMYRSVEHAFQAAKTISAQERILITNAKSAAQAKKIGKTLTLRQDWETHKFAIMESLIRQKFTRYPDLRQILLGTGDSAIIEGNTWGDVIWGAQWNAEHQTWVGRNALGITLMKVRQELRDQANQEQEVAQQVVDHAQGKRNKETWVSRKNTGRPHKSNKVEEPKSAN